MQVKKVGIFNYFVNWQNMWDEKLGDIHSIAEKNELYSGLKV